MATSFTLALTALQVVALVLGGLTNGFMLGVNLSDWKHCRSLTASDYFICAVGFSNLSLQIWSGFSWFCDLFWNMDLLCRAAYVLKMISIQCSLMVSGELCMFYCTKILTFHHTLFRSYQQYFLGSYRKIVIRSLISCIVMAWPLWAANEQPNQDKNLPFPNGSSIIIPTLTNEEAYVVIYRILVLSFGYTFPLALTVVSASLIIISLMRHTNRMRDALNAKHEAFIDAHLRAGFTVLSLLLLFVMYFIIAIINIIQIFHTEDVGSRLCQLVSMLYAPAHSIVLIRGNAKLKNAAAKFQKRVVGALKSKQMTKEDAAVYVIQH